jgi:hypothetical protein
MLGSFMGDEQDMDLAMLWLLTATSAAVLFQKRRRARQCKTRLINRKRNRLGFYNTTFLPMKNNDAKEFFAYTRMTVPLFTNLLEILKPRLKQQRIRRDSITSEMKLAVTLQ